MWSSQKFCIVLYQDNLFEPPQQGNSLSKYQYIIEVYFFFSSFRLKYIYLKIQLVFLFATFDSLFAHSKKLAGISLDLPKGKED